MAVVRYKKIVYMLLILEVLIAAIKAYAETSIKVYEKFNDDSLDLKQPRYLLPSTNNDMWILFMTTKNEVSAQPVKTKAKVIFNLDQKGSPSEEVGCVSEGKLHVVWRNKAETKTLNFRTLDLSNHQLGEKVIIDQSTEPLTRIKLGCIDSKINVVWYGEKGDAKGHKYSIYASQSKDGGKTFSQAFEVTPQTRGSLYPTLITDEQGNAYVFTEVIYENGQHEMVFRKTTDKGWEDPVSIGKVGVVSIYIRPLKVGNRLMVFWFNTYEGVPVTEMAYSDDGGKTWQRHAFEATRYIDLTGMQAVAGDDQHVYLALSGVNIKNKDDDPRKQKDELFFFYSHDGGKTFSGPVSIRHDQFGHYTRAHLPNIVAKGKNVVVVWNDYRNIRANLYMNYSADGGITWQSKDFPLEEPGKFNTVLHWDVNNLIEHGGMYHILAHRFKNDAMDAAYPVVISFKFKIQK
ncbi:MAG: sialidase family protein [Thermodesulforhabdaceae bacterium]